MTNAGEVAAEIVRACERAGAIAAEVLLEQASGFQAEARRGRVIDRESTSERVLSVTCWAEGGGRGSASGAPEKVKALVSEAIATARRAPSNPSGGPVGTLPSIAGGLGVDDRRYTMIEDADRLEVLLAAERATRGVDRRISTRKFEYADSRRERVYVNSRGVSRSAFETLYRLSGAVLVEGDSETLVLEGSNEGRSYASIASLPFGVTLAHRGLALLSPAPLPGGPFLFVLPPAATAQLVRLLGALFEREFVEPGSTFLSRRSGENELLLGNPIHLVDDGALAGGLRSRHFDDQGVPPVPVILLRAGKLEGRFIGPEVARSRDVRPTGHDWRGAKRVNNLILRSGTRTINALLSDRSDVVLRIDRFLDLEKSIDWTTGDIDVAFDGLVEAGAIRGRRLKGNLVDALRQVLDVSSDTDRIGAIDAPGLLFHGLEVV